MTLLTAATTLLPTISSLLDKVIPDADAKAKAQLELLRLQQEGVLKGLDATLQVNLAQAKINEVEAASQSGFQAGWRPLAGYVCVAGLGYEFLIRPLLPWLLTVAGVEAVPPLPSVDEALVELIFGMLGLGTLRTADRWKRMSALSQQGKTL